MKALEELKAAARAATQERIGAVVGDRACFHTGNRVSVVAVDDSNPEEVLTPTVAEFWPTSDDTDIADATLYVLMKNTIPALIECAEALETLAETVDAGESSDYRALQECRVMRIVRAALAKLQETKP